jgi:hypothetical protein
VKSVGKIPGKFEGVLVKTGINCVEKMMESG